MGTKRFTGMGTLKPASRGRLRLLTLATLLTLLLAACGGGGTAEDPDPPPAALSAPTEVTVTQVGSDLVVDWKHDGEGVAGFNIFRAISAATEAAPMQTDPLATLGPDARQFVDTSANMGQAYNYSVVATGPGVSSEPGAPPTNRSVVSGIGLAVGIDTRETGSTVACGFFYWIDPSGIPEAGVSATLKFPDDTEHSLTLFASNFESGTNWVSCGDATSESLGEYQLTVTVPDIGDLTATATLTSIAPRAQPVLGELVQTVDSITLDWQEYEGAPGYMVQLRADGGSTLSTEFLIETEHTFDISDLLHGNYEFIVYALAYYQAPGATRPPVPASFHIASKSAAFSVAFTCEDELSVVDIPDPVLADAIRAELGMGDGTDITCADIENLTFLEVGEDMNLESLEGLQFATNLDWLNINGNDVSDLTPLEGLVNLQTLHLGDNPVTNLSPLSAFGANLTFLDLGGITGTTNIAPLADLASLETLWLTWLSHEIHGPPDLSHLSGLSNLRHLSIDGASIDNIDALEGLELRELSASDNKLTNIQGIASSDTLENLYVNNNDLQSLPLDMNTLTNLVRLDLQDNPDLADVSAVTQLTGLIHLDTSNTNVSTSPDLSALTELQTFRSSGTNILFLPAFPTSLVNLELWENHVTNLAALETLVNLEFLGLSTNFVTDISPLVANTGFGAGDHLDLTFNCLDHTDPAVTADLDELRNRGVTLYGSDADNQRPVPCDH